MKRKDYASDFSTPTRLCFDPAGNLLVTNRSGGEIAKVSKSGAVSIITRGLRTPVGVAGEGPGREKAPLPYSAGFVYHGG